VVPVVHQAGARGQIASISGAHVGLQSLPEFQALRISAQAVVVVQLNQAAVTHCVVLRFVLAHQFTVMELWINGLTSAARAVSISSQFRLASS
jgi:hypothetical protein